MGDFDPDAALALAARYWGDWAGSATPIDASPEEPPGRPGTLKVLRGDVMRPIAAFGWRTVGPLHPDAPALDLAALDGGPRLTRAALEGRVSVLNVFASWCLPCLAEHPFLMALAKDGKAQIFGLNYKDKPADANAWLAKHGNPYARIGADRTGRAGIEWGVYGVPETFLIGPDGRIRFKVVGPITADSLKELRRMIGELGK